MKRPVDLLFIGLCLITITQAQLLGRFRRDDNSTDDESDDEESLFSRILAGKSDKERQSYFMQRQHFHGNKTSRHLLVKLKDSEDMDEDDASFFDPFFKWGANARKKRFQKYEDFKKKGHDKMKNKMDEWNMTGIAHRFYGAETGVSVLDLGGFKGDFMTAWMHMLGDKDVAFAEVDMGVDLFACNLVSDWGYLHTRADIAEEMLNLRDNNAKVLVAVIDSGIDFEHPLLRQRIWINEAERDGEPGVDDDGNGYVDDIYGWNFASNSSQVMDVDGHGTHVAGIIAAELSRNPEFTGVAPNVMILPCRFTEDSDSGSISAAIQCMEYAFEMDVDIMSNSWGGTGVSSLALEEAMRRANTRGILQITAAGNAGVDNDGSTETATFPASFDNDIIISVAAIEADGSLSSVSNYGSQTTDIGAPGVSITSTQIDGKFVRMSGTSQATPYVTAAAAILLGVCREREMECSAADIKAALLNGAVSTPALQGNLNSSGFLDIPNAARQLGLVDLDQREEPDLCNSAAIIQPPMAMLMIVALLLLMIP